ncbi:MAG: hypothetical protein GY771_08920 [bacterium]|nr:hypothetical protein [bacterium]
MRKTEEETFNSLCDGLAKLHVKDEPDDMPDEIWVGDHNWNPEYHFKHNPHHYRKVKKCHWVWHDECENPHWDVDCDAITAPQRKHPSIDLYTHCPYCGGRIER